MLVEAARESTRNTQHISQRCNTIPGRCDFRTKPRMVEAGRVVVATDCWEEWEGVWLAVVMAVVATDRGLAAAATVVVAMAVVTVVVAWVVAAMAVAGVEVVELESEMGAAVMVEVARAVGEKVEVVKVGEETVVVATEVVAMVVEAAEAAAKVAAVTVAGELEEVVKVVVGAEAVVLVVDVNSKCWRHACT